MRRPFSRLIVAQALWTLACATAIEEGGLGGSLEGEHGGSSSGGALVVAGSSNGNGGSSNTSGSPSMSGGGKAGSSTGAFGGSNTGGGMPGTAGAGGSKGGAASGGNGGASSAGNGGVSGSTSDGGKAGSGGSSAGSANGGSGTAGSPGSTVCDNVPDWSSKAYAIGDTVAASCSAPFNGTCPVGQSHKFECNPQAGAVALTWCQQRPPGSGNGWAEAWVDKGQCQ